MFVRIVYTFVLFLLSPYLLYRLYRKKTNHPKFGSRWKEHFGLTPPLKTKVSPLWIHAVSVGESILAVSLVKKIKQEFPELPIVITTTTSTGAAEIAKLGDLAEHRYMPIDFGFAVRGFFKNIHPCQMLIIETELWPNTLCYARKKNIPVTVVNARLSEKSCQNYKKILPLFSLMTPALHKILCQTDADSKHFSSLGITQNKLIITGSIKFDIHISEEIRAAGKQLRAQLGEKRPVWIAASTHQGEDELILRAHRQLLEIKPDCLLILVPRHPERFDTVFGLCHSHGFHTIRRTSRKPLNSEHNVYLADTMGEMLTLLGSADVCFMGGSLMGDKVGGHNVLEPAALGVPVITGPSYYNFREIVERMQKEDAIKIVQDSTEIHSAVNELLTEFSRSEITEKLLNIVKKNQGSTDKTVKEIAELIQ